MYHGDPKKFNRVRCAKGHELSGANLYIRPNTTQYACKACKKINDAEYRERQRLAKIKRARQYE